jgi:hypothetical protein
LCLTVEARLSVAWAVQSPGVDFGPVGCRELAEFIQVLLSKFDPNNPSIQKTTVHCIIIEEAEKALRIFQCFKVSKSTGGQMEWQMN